MEREEMDVGADGADGLNRVQRASKKDSVRQTNPMFKLQGEQIDLSNHGACTESSETENSRLRGILLSEAHALHGLPVVSLESSIFIYILEHPCTLANRLCLCSEKKIDRIEDRLSGIEIVLEKLANRLSDIDVRKETTDSSSHTRSSRIGRSPNSSSDVPESTPAPFEGESTLNSQSVFARELLEQAVGSTPSMGQNAEIKTALTSLQSMVSRQNQTITIEPQPVFNTALADIDTTKLEKPPWDAVLDVIEKAATYPTMCFAIVFPWLKLSNLREIAKKTFDTPHECSTGRRILVYGVLYNLFIEFAVYPLLGGRIHKFRQYGLQCRTHMEIAISQLDFFTAPTYENILALVLAASFAVELCKPSLCWVMNSAAADLCQQLGYHRISTMKNDTEEERAAKIHVFWFVYMMDKQLSLRLGRSSAIQDYDMSLPYPDTRTSGGYSAYPNGAKMHLYWVKMAQIQGLVYEKLFSPAAFLKPFEERAQIAADLVYSLEQTWTERGASSAMDFTQVREQTPSNSKGPNETPAPSTIPRAPLVYPTTVQISLGASLSPMKYIEGTLDTVEDLFYHADVLVHYSTLSLIQRAVSPDNTSFGQDCLNSSRAALVAHQRASEKYNIEGNEDLWSGYIHWSVLQAPFTPFIVLFCNIINTGNQSDLATLSSFVASLESCRTISEGADKLYKMCHLFLQVSKLYLEAKTKETPANFPESSQSQNEASFYGDAEGGFDLGGGMTQFDPYLSALGLMPNSTWPGEPFPSMPPGMENYPAMDSSGMGNQNSVQDWFSGSRYIMGLMEEDIMMPDFGG
ncbi:fungal-specific transcription factor domain-containing protein [Lophiotrema nucula]|uniref:Fungal-specific transcription factor domain-containing protein n=1 Tax=Lophiotrema nucula TaxID=690887 RepID=A0A6A5YNI5_9PLEO|nr:fungal-specific transcription factor domain-containing protein [Lophiotrema nucula]